MITIGQRRDYTTLHYTTLHLLTTPPHSTSSLHCTTPLHLLTPSHHPTTPPHCTAPSHSTSSLLTALRHPTEGFATDQTGHRYAIRAGFTILVMPDTQVTFDATCARNAAMLHATCTCRCLIDPTPTPLLPRPTSP